MSNKFNMNDKEVWDLELECKPDFAESMERIYAWYEGEIIDRAPIRFSAHNAFVDDVYSQSKWDNIKDRWFDAGYQVDNFLKVVQKSSYLAETFPIFWPNLGPNMYAAFYGAELIFADSTSWAEPCLENLEDASKLKFDMGNEYFVKLTELTDYALERCSGKFMVGYSDFHPGMDCLAAWRDTQKLCIDLYDNPDGVKLALQYACNDFKKIFDFFDSRLKDRKQLSSTWMGIPSYGKMHIPSCDFSAMISEEHFEEFCLPIIKDEVKDMTHNIFHLDGKGVARHLDMILDIPEIDAIQWVQGEGADKPIMQWIPLIKKIRDAGKSVVVDLNKQELENFISEVGPEGILLCVDAQSYEDQKKVIEIVKKWR